jgi:hypothetical protein
LNNHTNVSALPATTRTVSGKTRYGYKEMLKESAQLHLLREIMTLRGFVIWNNKGIDLREKMRWVEFGNI